ncbi:GIY-YIG nuclease family protein [Oceanobacillus massiliensis]|uniref:GIY-YIG nuclease family protein n=1 Tax=Oceanobacillus massiliensis TaxID=1465765 RepID=UPI003018B783
MSNIYRKTIKIFLIDGEPTGRMSAELSNWTGKAYKIPRNKIKDSIDRPELSGTGVYFLFGEDDEGNDVAYIGEAENVLSRLNSHLREKDFWTEVVVFTSKDDNLNKAHIKYLEHKLHQLAEKIGRYKMKNNTIPTLPAISESDEAEMEEYIINSRLLIGTLGHNLFEDKISTNKDELDQEKIYFIKAARGADASMVQTTEGFAVIKGSRFADPVANSFPPSLNKIRELLLEKELLIIEDGKLILTDNRVFSSPSTAASIVMGRNANGLTEWKNREGQTLRDMEGFQED